MKKTLIFLVLCILLVSTVFTVCSYAATPEVISSPQPDASLPANTPTATTGQITKVTPEPMPNNKGSVQVLNPGDTEGSVNSTGEIVFMAIIVLVCLFFVLEGVFSLFIKKKK